MHGTTCKESLINHTIVSLHTRGRRYLGNGVSLFVNYLTAFNLPHCSLPESQTVVVEVAGRIHRAAEELLQAVAVEGPLLWKVSYREQVLMPFQGVTAGLVLAVVAVAAADSNCNT